MLAKTLDNLLHERKTAKSDFAQHIGVARTTLDRYLCEKTFMPSDKIIKTAAFFNVSIGYLFGEDRGEGKTLQQQILEQQEQIKQLTKVVNSIKKKKQ